MAVPSAHRLSPGQSDELRSTVRRIVAETRLTDIHTHLYPPVFAGHLLWGIDELLTYHYLIAEVLRVTRMPPEEFWASTKPEQARRIWDELFLRRSPVSEACRGVLTTLRILGLDVGARDLDSYREWFARQDTARHVERVFELAGVESVVMTNDPFDDAERVIWERATNHHPRFHAALRIDPLLNDWPHACKRLGGWGYRVEEQLDDETCAEIRRFLLVWLKRMDARYMAVSLPPDFQFPEDSPRSKVIAECVIPVARELYIPFALMIGVSRQINPSLGLAGDGVGTADLTCLQRLCVSYPDNNFMTTVLSRENQHELCVLARKFPNLLPFGCWWFLNNPVLIEEMTRMRLELLGLSVVPQHSDARVLEQVIYKWDHSRTILTDVLSDKYCELLETGWTLEDGEIRRDVESLLGGYFWEFTRRP